MPQPLRRKNAPIDWNIQIVANHPVLTSGVGACITAFAQAEALMGVYLATIRWGNAPDAIELWASKRTIRDKLKLIDIEAGLAGDAYQKMAVAVLDGFTSLSKRRNKLAHGVFGIVKDRENEFAWREGSAAAVRLAQDLDPSNVQTLAPPSRTWIYKSNDFGLLAQDCVNQIGLIEKANRVMPVFRGLTDSF